MSMTNEQKLDMVKTLLGFDSGEGGEDERIAVYLSAAGKEILGWRYSYAAETPDAVPDEYEMTQIHAVIAGYSQAGAEAQVTHSENGISRTFKYADMVHYIRSNVIPYAKAVT